MPPETKPKSYVQQSNGYPTFSGKRWSQIKSEVDQMMEVFLAEKVSRYCELGAREGDTFHYIMSRLPKGSSGVAVDWPGGPWGRAGSRERLVKAVHNLNSRGYDCTVVFGNLRTLATREMVSRRAPFDGMFIDGGHQLDDVLGDWAEYGQMARIVAFHDVAAPPGHQTSSGLTVDVPKVWETIKRTHKYRECIAKGSQMGIGVAWV